MSNRLNSRNTTPTCFCKNALSSGSTYYEVKTSYKLWNNITKFRNLWCDVQVISIVDKKYMCGLKSYC